MFDILITIAQKDFNKLPFVMESIVFHIKGYHKIHIVSDCAIPDEFLFTDAELHTDNEIFDFDFSRINMEHRRGWYRQQFIKLFQNVTLDNYLVIDGDIYINKPFVIDSSKPVFYIGKDQHHFPYFKFMKDVFSLEQAYSHSFITEIMFFKKDIIQSILNQLRRESKPDFFNVFVDEINKINDPSSFSEYELYGNWVSKNRVGWYGYQPIRVLQQSRNRRWGMNEVKDYIHRYRVSNYDLLTMHTWL